MGKLSGVKNLWERAKAAKQAGVVQMGKKVISPLVKPAIIGGAAGYGGYQYLDNKNQSDLQDTTDETGIAVHTGEDGRPDMKSIFQYIKENPEEARLKGIQAGPTNNGDAYGDFLNVQNAIKGKNAPKPFEGVALPDPTKGAGGFDMNSVKGPGSVKMPEFRGSRIPFEAMQRQNLLSPEELEILKRSPELDASGMDESLEMLRERYAGREQRKENQIQAIEGQDLNVDLSPVMDLWKSWYGADFSSYKKPETNDERMARVYKMRDDADKEGAAREEALYNAADKISGRKLDVSKFNQEQPIDAMARIAKARGDQVGLDRDVVKSSNENEVKQASHEMDERELLQRIQAAENANLLGNYNAQTSRMNVQSDAAFKAAKPVAGEKSRINPMFDALMKDATKARLKMVAGEDPAKRMQILSLANQIAEEQFARGDKTPPAVLLDEAVNKAISLIPSNPGAGK